MSSTVVKFSVLSSLAQQTDDGSQYYILLILTDGIICDMPQTKAAVVNVSLSSTYFINHFALKLQSKFEILAYLKLTNVFLGSFFNDDKRFLPHIILVL